MSKSRFEIRYHIEAVEDDYSRIIHIYCLPDPPREAYGLEDAAHHEVRMCIARMRDANIIHEEDVVKPRFWWDGKPGDWWFKQKGTKE